MIHSQHKDNSTITKNKLTKPKKNQLLPKGNSDTAYNLHDHSKNREKNCEHQQS